MINDKVYQFHGSPPVVGYWILPGSSELQQFKFGMTAKPNWFHRHMMQLLLGWKWEDA